MKRLSRRKPAPPSRLPGRFVQGFQQGVEDELDYPAPAAFDFRHRLHAGNEAKVGPGGIEFSRNDDAHAVEMTVTVLYPSEY